MDDKEARHLLENAKKCFKQAKELGNAELAIDAAAVFEMVSAWGLAAQAREFAARLTPQKAEQA